VENRPSSDTTWSTMRSFRVSLTCVPTGSARPALYAFEIVAGADDHLALAGRIAVLKRYHAGRALLP